MSESEQGGSGGGQQTVSVSAPVFAGETQFEESTLYEGPITLSETTTVKAIAIKDGVSSSVTSRTYTKGTNAGGEDEPGGDDH